MREMSEMGYEVDDLDRDWDNEDTAESLYDEDDEDEDTDE